MTAVYQPPASILLRTSTEFDSSGNPKKPNLLYKKLTPRKKIDEFGIDQTDYQSYFLSSAVFPTGVKATFMTDIQESTPNLCGFDIVQKPAVEGSLISKSTTFIHAPPPTAEQSLHSYRGSLHSVPIVALVEKAQSQTSGERRTSANSKVTINSKVHSDIMPRQELGGSDVGLTRQNLLSNKEMISEKEPFIDYLGDPGEIDDATLDRMVQEKIRNFKLQLEKERQAKSLKSSKHSNKAVPRVMSYSSCDAMRLIKYQWMTRESRLADEKKDGGDIRDPLYLNTFFPEERPVRYHKMSLPRIPRTVKLRPWTVAEANISARAQAMKTAQSLQPQRASRTAVGKAKGGNSHGAFSQIGLFTVPGRATKARLVVSRNDNNDESKDSDNDNDRPLLEIRPFLANSQVTDQRDKLKGKDGCLNSRVKQCVRFVRYRERLDKQGDDRPMKAEAGRYRPISKTDVRDHAITNPPPTPEAKLQKSVETYQKYVENIAVTTKLTSPKPFTFRGSQNSSRRPTGTTSSALDSDSLVVQSVMESNLPDMSVAPSRASLMSPRPHESAALYTRNMDGMKEALDIKRLSPKLSTNRIVPGTRGVIYKELSPRHFSASTDEGVGMSEATSTNAIVVPMVAKSDCPSEYSVAVSKDGSP